MAKPTQTLRQRIARRLRGVTDTTRVEDFWSSAFESGGIDTWLGEPQVRQYANELITGCANEWPMDAFRRLYVSQPFRRALSIGCGEGALERDIRKKNICRHATGVDLSGSALRSARAAARREKIRRIRYRRADFNRLRLPRNRYDLVFFHQSLHHVAELEHCLKEVKKTLRPKGFLYLDEYVGPSRTEWSAEHLEPANRIFAELPAEIRGADEIPAPIEFDDPSEAIRSSEIGPMVERGFTILHRRDYGGNVLALVHPLIRWQRLDPAARAELVERLIDADRALLEAGVPSLYSVIVATH